MDAAGYEQAPDQRAWTHILTYDLTADGVKYKLAGTHGPTAVSGDTGTPKDRAQATIQWTKGPFTATATVNYIGRFNVPTRPSGNYHVPGRAATTATRYGGRNTGGVAPDYCNVASFTYVNLNFLYPLNKQWTLHGVGPECVQRQAADRHGDLRQLGGPAAERGQQRRSV